MLRLICCLTLAALCISPIRAADEEEGKTEKKLEPAALKLLSDTVGVAGETKGKVHTIQILRSDLDVRTVDHGEIPAEAGLCTTLRVWRCNCGKYYILGEFCVTDYEMDDVIDSLRQGHMRIASVAPMLIADRPRLMLIRFQGEGGMDALAKTTKEAFRWMGENRSKPQPIKE